LITVMMPAWSIVRGRSLDKRRQPAIPVDVHNLAHAMPYDARALAIRF